MTLQADRTNPDVDNEIPRPKRRLRRWLLLMALVTGAAGLMAWTVTPSFGRLPEGERLERIQRSPNFVDGEFRNLDTTELFTKPGARWKSAWDFFFESKESLSPPHPLPMLETDLKVLDPQRDLVIWLGHSSYYMQLGGQRILIDPVFSAYASPVPFINWAFSGPYPYAAADMPPIDVLLLTHDHWDHVDYPTLTALKDKIASVITPLGVGAHLERWGFEPGRIHELDWYEHRQIAPQFTVHAVPARHFSGRGLRGNRTLWAGFMLEAPDRRVYISGDSGYGRHFAEIGQRFGPVDLAIVENGQYDPSWAAIHILPEQVVQAAQDVHAKTLMPSHSGRFALAKHAWDEPYKRLTAASAGRPYTLLIPRIGEVAEIGNAAQAFARWWEGVSP